MSETVDEEYWIDRARERIEKLTMPHWALGRICDLMVELVRIQQTNQPEVEPAVVMVFAGDHGVNEEDVSAYPSEVTSQMLRNFVSGGAAISVLARQHKMQLFVVDMGSRGEKLDTKSSQYIPVRLQPGTRNFLHEQAMDEQIVQAAVSEGQKVVNRLFETVSPRVVVLGEMGIGNTSSSSAITALLLDVPPEEVVGRGSGIDDRKLDKKKTLVRQAVERHAHCKGDPWQILAAVGGLETAGMVGALLEAAKQRQVILLDGFVVAAAAALACRIDPTVCNYLIAAHRSAEPGHRFLLEAMKLRPLLEIEMRLGEGSGAVLAWPLLRSAALLYQQMATFEQAHVAGKCE